MKTIKALYMIITGPHKRRRRVLRTIFCPNCSQVEEMATTLPLWAYKQFKTTKKAIYQCKDCLETFKLKLKSDYEQTM